jgi:DNA-binding protein H-NS
MNSSSTQSTGLTKDANQEMAARLQQAGEVLSFLGARVIAPGDEPAWLTSRERPRPPTIQTMSRQELEKLQRDVGKALVELEQRKRAEALSAAQKAAAQYGFSLGEILGSEVKGTATDRGSKPAPKYQSPDESPLTLRNRLRKQVRSKSTTENQKTKQRLRESKTS